jgi:acyl dehydratase
MTAARLRQAPPFDSIEMGDYLPVLEFPLPVYRLVMAAGATRDYAPIHHNDDFARASGAPSMYANAMLLLGMWERVLRDYIGPAGTIVAIRDLRMVRFALAGEVVHVHGRVLGKRVTGGRPTLEIGLRSLVGNVLTVGPGLGVVTLADGDHHRGENP